MEDTMRPVGLWLSLCDLLECFESRPLKSSDIKKSFRDFLKTFGQVREAELPTLIDNSTELRPAEKRALRNMLNAIVKVCQSVVVWQDETMTIEEYKELQTKLGPSHMPVYDLCDKIEYAIKVVTTVEY